MRDKKRFDDPSMIYSCLWALITSRNVSLLPRELHWYEMLLSTPFSRLSSSDHDALMVWSGSTWALFTPSLWLSDVARLLHLAPLSWERGLFAQINNKRWPSRHKTQNTAWLSSCLNSETDSFSVLCLWIPAEMLRLCVKWLSDVLVSWLHYNPRTLAPEPICCRCHTEIWPTKTNSYRHNTSLSPRRVQYI